MWFSLILLALLIGVAVRQATQGLFGALITTALTCCAAALAVGTYEWVAIHWVAPHWRPDYAYSISLGVMFGVPLILARAVVDLAVKRSCLLPAWADRVGAGLCGVVTAMTMVGIFAVSVQMLPFENGTVLGYRRLPAEAQGDAAQKGLLLSPDRFALTIAEMLSAGAFGSGKDAGLRGPDPLEHFAWVGTVHAEVSRFAPPGSIKVLGALPVEAVFKLTPGEERRGTQTQLLAVPPSGGNRFHAVRLQLRQQARDKRKSHAFSPRQIRVVGTRAGSPEHYHASAVRFEQGAQENGQYIASIVSGRVTTPVVEKVYQPVDAKGEIEVVFETPADFKPTFVEYKRGARAEISFEDRGVFASEDAAAAPPTDRLTTATTPASAAPPPAAPPPPAAQPSEPQEFSGRRARRAARPQPADEPAPTRRRGGNVRGVTTSPGGSHFGDAMPMTLRSYQRLQNVEVKGDALVSGHLVGRVADQSDGASPAIGRFFVPEDKRLLQLASTKLQARSGLGRIITQAIATVQNYYVEDEQGRQFKVVGKYAIADVNGEQVVEIQYFSEFATTIGGMGKFSRIQEERLSEDDTFVLLFLVDPGAQIRLFSSGGSPAREDDLRSERLVAPD